MGHSHPRVIAASLKGALSDIVNQGNLQPNREYGDFLQKIVSLAGKNSRMKHGWLSTCGTMANECALKIARQKHSPARMILSFKNAFAGRSTMMAEVTDNPAYKQGLPEYNEVLRIPFYDKNNPKSGEEALNKMKEHIAHHPKNISCFVFEPMLGEGGYQAAPREFFIPLLDLCKANNIAVWADEIQTFSRTGELFAFETLGLSQYIDICTIAKTAQVGVTLYTEEYNPKPGLIAGTFSGASAALTAGMEILDILQEGYLGPQGKIIQIHNKFISMLNGLNATTCKGLLTDAGGMGLMVAVTPYDGKKEKVDALLKRMFENGLVAFSCGKDPVRIRFLIPAIIQDADIEVAKQIIEKSVLQGLE
jgi:acetylornithine/N-succinyldiaminopimelate aminotransferase